ncbi:undecaprenyldiphospho-muramoylpentapeptide beta-N-acetylglucosaminyltransferase [Spongiimicrobium sp. 2-473A-2-J]|uniref:undecaprenyldiphospho-muramoylpentapeptide beta-N-acetylglucosaminyltransferase n=1 Tax=Eudoraea algarum TaxID=3417568 RepID=UPI003D366E70
MDNYRFILSGGGTGGHIYPAIAIANELKKRHANAEFLFVGAKDKMEMEKVPQAGYAIQGLWISGLQRKLTLKNVLFPIKLISSLITARNIVAKFRPHVVIGTGGFASGPLLRMAAGKGIPCVVQEQNSYAGITNKLLAKRMRKIFVAYEGMQQFFPEDKIVKTGNPVREDLVAIKSNREDALRFFGLPTTKHTLLVVGGSLGARRINQFVAQKLDFFKDQDVQVIWQSGKLYYTAYQNLESGQVKVLEYLDRMDLAYAAADIIISRSGAGAVSELSIVGKPVIFIPSPNVAEDHQTKNAQALEKEGAALLLRERDLESDFETVFSRLMASEDERRELSVNIKKMARPHATKQIVDEIEKLL